MSKKKPTTSVLLKRKRAPSIRLPEKLEAMKITPAHLAGGKFQQKIQAHFAKPVLVRAFNAMIRNLDNNDSRSVQQAMEVYGILSGKRGDLNIVMNQSNQNASVARSSKENGAFASFEEIARVVDGERRKLLSGPTEVIEAHFEPTPDD
jgi:hypothetical protein